MNREIVSIRWGDACQPQTHVWYAKDELPKPKAAEIVTVGWIVRESPTAIVVASSVGTDEVYSGVIVIPRAAVRMVMRLTEEACKEAA